MSLLPSDSFTLIPSLFAFLPITTEYDSKDDTKHDPYRNPQRKVIEGTAQSSTDQHSHGDAIGKIVF